MHGQGSKILHEEAMTDKYKFKTLRKNMLDSILTALYPEFDVKFAWICFVYSVWRPKRMKVIIVTMKKRKAALAFPRRSCLQRRFAMHSGHSDYRSLIFTVTLLCHFEVPHCTMFAFERVSESVAKSLPQLVVRNRWHFDADSVFVSRIVSAFFLRFGMSILLESYARQSR